MNKRIKALIILVFVLLICGCGSKTKEAITSKTFINVVEEKMEINDIGDSYSYANEAYLAYNSGNEMEILYAKGENSYEIKSVFADEVSNVLGGLQESDTIKTSKGDNWERLEANNKDTYYYLIRIDNTYVYSKCKMADKNTLKNILKDLDLK